MRIETIHAHNFLAHRDTMIRVDPASRALLICGPNGSGKTAITTGIKLALTGDLIRGIAYKKELPELITQGQKTGDITVVIDGDLSYKLSLKTGNHAGSAPPLPGNPLSMDPAAFFALDQTARRKLIFQLAGIVMKPDVIVKELVDDKGYALPIATQIKDHLRLGFEGAAKRAAELATEAKGMWRATTGETWGAVKADGWEAPTPDIPEIAESEDDLAAEVETCQRRINTAKVTLDEANARAAAHAAAERATGAVIDVEAVKNTNLDLTEELQATKAIVDRLRESTSQGIVAMACPCCEASLVVESGKLKEVDKASVKKPAADGDGKLLAARTKVSDLEAKIRNNQQVIANGEAAARLTSNLPEKISDKELKKARSDHEVALAQLTVAQKNLTDKIRAREAGGEVAARTLKAKLAHEEIGTWMAMAETLLAMPGEYLGNALKKMNALASEASKALAASVQIGADMGAMYGTIRYDMASESEQWRCQLAIGYALAKMGGLNLLVLDRFDLVEVAARPAILKWIASLEDVQVILAGTMKEKPKLPASIQVEWLGA